MAKHPISYYGDGDAEDQRAPGHRASCGGVERFKELPYSPPVGPKGQMDKGPGLHGTNHGNCGTRGKR